MSTSALALITLASGVVLTMTLRWVTRGDQHEPDDEVARYKAELWDNWRRLRIQRDEWQDRYYAERDARLKAEWQLETLRQFNF